MPVSNNMKNLGGLYSQREINGVSSINGYNGVNFFEKQKLYVYV